MIIDHKTIKTLNNYFLIKVDPDFENYHLNGKETDIAIGKSLIKQLDEEGYALGTVQDTYETISTADHWSDTGTIITCPEFFTFLGKEIYEITKKGDAIDEKDIRELSSLRENSLKFVTDIDCKIGDRIKFNYMCRMSSIVIKTDIGDLLCIHYNDFIGRFDDDETFIPLNGNIIFELIQPKQSELEIKTTKRIWDLKGIQKGVVLKTGSTIKQYIDKINYIDGTKDLKEGDTIYFKSYNANNLESENHFFIFGGKEVFYINRNDILGTE